jgi:hypothetical protein
MQRRNQPKPKGGDGAGAGKQMAKNIDDEDGEQRARLQAEIAELQRRLNEARNGGIVFQEGAINPALDSVLTSVTQPNPNFPITPATPIQNFVQGRTAMETFTDVDATLRRHSRQQSTHVQHRAM